MQKTSHTILLALAALVIASLACNLSRSASPSPTPRPTIPVSTTSVQELEQSLNEAAGDLQQGKQVTLILTESQLTSLVASSFQNTDGPILQNPQVYLRDGQVQLMGTIEQSGVGLPLEILVTPRVDSSGNLEYSIDSAKIGPFPIPQAQLNQLSTELDKAIAAQMGQGEERIILDGITISDGTMVITGHKQ
jgi:uncharacterized protein YpmS